MWHVCDSECKNVCVVSGREWWSFFFFFFFFFMKFVVLSSPSFQMIFFLRLNANWQKWSCQRASFHSHCWTCKQYCCTVLTVIHHLSFRTSFSFRVDLQFWNKILSTVRLSRWDVSLFLSVLTVWTKFGFSMTNFITVHTITAYMGDLSFHLLTTWWQC